MAEPSAAAAVPPSVAAERDALLATKLNVPGPRPGQVPRPRLSEQLDEGLRRGLVLVCAPAGYGKTVLLAEWAQRSQVPAAWLSLDGGDNDPARFWRHAIAALDRVHAGIGGRVGPLLGPPAPPSFEPLVTALINELAAGPGGDGVLLVLDDYHAIGSQPVHASVGFLLEHRPPGLHVALASRSDPPLALARLRARGQLTELRAADLRFTAGEAAGAAGAAGATAAAWRCPRRPWRRWWPGPRGGRPGCSWPPCRCAGRRTWAGSLRPSPAATATCWTIWPKRCWSGRASRYAPSCWKPRYWTGCRASCVTRSPAGPAARRCWSRWSGPDCSWYRWMRSAAGGATTICSPTCSAPGCRPNSPARWRSCTATPPAGTRSTGWPMRPSGTPSPPVR